MFIKINSFFDISFIILCKRLFLYIYILSAIFSYISFSTRHLVAFLNLLFFIFLFFIFLQQYIHFIFFLASSALNLLNKFVFTIFLSSKLIIKLLSFVVFSSNLEQYHRWIIKLKVVPPVMHNLKFFIIFLFSTLYNVLHCQYSGLHIVTPHNGFLV